MKKTVFLCMFLCVSVFFCFADEWVKNDESIEASPLFSYSGLPVKTWMFESSTVNPVWKQADWGLTKYSDDYPSKSFLEVTSPILKGLLIAGGIVAFACGIGASGDPDNLALSVILMTGGLIATGSGIALIIID